MAAHGEKDNLEMHVAFMRRAIELSLENVRSGDGGPFGAVIVRDGKILAACANRVTASHDPTAHAEVTAIREACRKLGTHVLAGCAIYASCEPCPMCLAAIYWARIDRIYFANTQSDAASIGFDDRFLYEEFSRDAARRKVVMTPLLRDEALRAFTQWQNSPNKIPY